MLNFCSMAMDTDDIDDKKVRYKELYQKYRQDMYAIAYSILKNNEDAEDAVHNAFLSIAKNFEKISKISCHEMDRYIVIIIRNASIDIYKQNKRRLNRCEQLDKNEDEISTDVDFLENFTREMVADALSKLSPTYKDVIYLYYYEELKDSEISKILGIEPAAVRKRLERARKKIKNYLRKEYGYGK